MSVEGHKSTLGNTDTSSAKTLPPAENSEIREFKQHHGSKASQEKGQRHGQTHTQGHSSSGGSQGGSAKTASTQTPSAGGSKHVGIAPTYVEPVLGAGVDPKPKGKDLKEGGFDKDASQNPPGDNGSKMDPARLAEMRFEARAAETPVHAAVPGGGGEPGVSTKSEQPYGALEPEQEA